MLKKIVVKGAKEHNLKNVSLEIPKEKEIGKPISNKIKKDVNKINIIT
mgnify:CR=1 FL=1